MRTMTTKARITLANIDEMQARRKALEGKRFDVVFYGGWYVIDNHDDTTDGSHESMDDALTAAEAANA